MTILQRWIYTGDGVRTIYQVFQVFQTHSEPEVLALALADMLLLWVLDPPLQVNGPHSTTSDLIGLEKLLSEHGLLKNSYKLLLHVQASLCAAIIKVLEPKRSAAIVEFLSGAVCITEDICPIKELTDNMVEKLTVQAAQVTAAEIDTLGGKFVVL